jgi:hypothetical protein
MEAQIGALAATPAPLPSAKWSDAIAAFEGVFRALAMVLSVRIMLLLALAGGFYLATVAMERQSVISVVVLVAYAMLVIGPAAFLEHGRKAVGAAT